MRRWSTAFAIVFALGLIRLPFPAQAQAEEGARSGQETHDQHDKQIRGERQQETGVKSKAKKDHVTEQGTAETPHDHYGGHNDRQEQVEEGSH